MTISKDQINIPEQNYLKLLSKKENEAIDEFITMLKVAPADIPRWCGIRGFTLKVTKSCSSPSPAFLDIIIWGTENSEDEEIGVHPISGLFENRYYSRDPTAIELEAHEEECKTKGYRSMACLYTDNPEETKPQFGIHIKFDGQTSIHPGAFHEVYGGENLLTYANLFIAISKIGNSLLHSFND